MTANTQSEVGAGGGVLAALRSLTKAVRAFGDGDMSAEVRDRLFLSKYDGPEQATFAALCEANDAAESALAAYRGAATPAGGGDLPELPEGWSALDWGSWLRDRGSSFDPYVQGPLFAKLAIYIESLPTRLASTGSAPAPSAVPEGFVLVPVEPTEAMMEAADRAVNSCTYEVYPSEVAGIYRVMLAAAPTQSQEAPAPSGEGKRVPRIPTPLMDAAGKQALSDNGVCDVHEADALVCWEAMYSAAPTQEQQA